MLRYLARYVFRVAITNSRIVGLDERVALRSAISIALRTDGAPSD